MQFKDRFEPTAMIPVQFTRRAIAIFIGSLKEVTLMVFGANHAAPHCISVTSLAIRCFPDCLPRGVLDVLCTALL